MYKILRRLLFLFDPEFIHDSLIIFLRFPLVSKLLGIFYRIDHPSLERNLFGITFRNPIGLAAGFDKNGELVSQMADLGFGFVEIGTVTPEPQEGNPKPRIFRLKADEALINRMGFNNKGVQEIAAHLRKQNLKIIIGGNIGKNKLTPNELAVGDYEICFNQLYPLVDFFVINVSSPNTPQLRELQEKEPLTNLLLHLKEINETKPQSKPIFLKIAPDLSFTQLDDIIQIIQETHIEGIIATNTTIERKNLKMPVADIEKIGDGGLSGKPLAARSTEIIRYLHQKSAGKIPIIGVGGIHSVDDALEKFDAGASFIELYTGFIYEGPGLIKKINRALIQKNK